MQKSKAELKEIFVSGAKPQAQDFHDWMDSYMHKEDLTAALERLERISIEGDLAWQVDGELDEGSDNPVKNSAVTQAVKALQEAIDGNGASLEEVSGQIDELLGTIAGKASASTVTALQAALAALQTTVSGKASGSELAALGETVTAIAGRIGTAETAIAGKMSVQQGSANAGKVPMVGADGNLVLTDEVGAVKSVSVNGGDAVIGISDVANREAVGLRSVRDQDPVDIWGEEEIDNSVVENREAVALWSDDQATSIALSSCLLRAFFVASFNILKINLMQI